MFNLLSVLPPRAIIRGQTGRGADRSNTRLIPIGLAVALALSAGTVLPTPGKALAAGGGDPVDSSIQYQEALAHSSETYSFPVGDPVTVPYQPRFGDTSLVDGAAPVPLPAGAGVEAPSLAPSAAGQVTPSGTVNLLRREVFGFLPYWELGSTLDYDTLSTIAYFGVDLKADGTLNTSSSGWSGWVGSTMTSVINAAHAHGTRVALTIQSFAWDSAGLAAQAAILSSPSLSLTAAQQIAAEVGRRGADGVNLDFEPIATSQGENYVTFVRLVRAELDKVHAGYELTFCATGRPSSYDLTNLLASGAADATFIMAYDFRGGLPATTGSIDPLVSPTIYDLNDAVKAFTAQAPASKIILGLPWYGHAWSTGLTNKTLNAPPALSTADIALFGQSATTPYSTAKTLASAISDASHIGWQYDPAEQTAWTAYYGNYGGTSDTWRELYFDDAQALGAKCDAIDAWNLRGVGIWALGYDSNNGNGDLTHEIAVKLQTGVTGSTYHPITPVRLLDTRVGNGLSTALSANTPATFQVTGRGGVPANATAVTGNVTVVDETAPFAVYLGPVPTANPTSSTLNFVVGDITANTVTVALGTGGKLSVTYMAAAGNTTDLVLDVSGFFTPDVSGSTYHPITPVRLLDSRVANGLSTHLSANTPATFQVTGRGGIPAEATAVTGNLTVTGETDSWAVYLGPNPIAHPTSSTVNFVKGDIRANGVTVALGTGAAGSGPLGSLSATYMATAGNATDLVFDVSGYFAPGLGGSTYVPIDPVRLLDTRAGNGLSARLSANTPATFTIGGRGGVPANAVAVTGNVTVTGETDNFALYVGPIPTASPGSSTINFNKGDVRANGATLALGTGGTLSATYLSPAGNTTDLLFDVTGYFVP